MRDTRNAVASHTVLMLAIEDANSERRVLVPSPLGLHTSLNHLQPYVSRIHFSASATLGDRIGQISGSSKLTAHER